MHAAKNTFGKAVPVDYCFLENTYKLDVREEERGKNQQQLLYQ